MVEFEFTDRYKMMGIPDPDPKTMCLGQCEGTGWVPHCKGGDLKTGDDEIYDKLWDEAHEKAGEHDCDSWHFVKCPTCKGTGKAITGEAPTKSDKED